MATPVGRLGGTTRWALVAAALGLLAVLGVARWLRPDPRGYGTHEQLGLDPCPFRGLTGRPCPACGLTTAFAWSVRGEWVRAARANPAGGVLAGACAVLIPWLLACAAAGRPVGSRTLDVPLMAIVVAAVALGLGAWTFRMILGRALG
jgi:hypothetical protein